MSSFWSSFRKEVSIVTAFVQSWSKCHWSDLRSSRPVVQPRVESRSWSSLSAWLSKVNAFIRVGQVIWMKGHLHRAHSRTGFDLASLAHVEGVKRGRWPRSPSLRVWQHHTAASSSAGSVILIQPLHPGFLHLLETVRLIGKQCGNENTGTFQEVVVSGGIISNVEFSFCLQAWQSRRLPR